MRGGLGLTLVLAALLAPATPAHAGSEREVIFVLYDDFSYEAALAQPSLRALAASGGIGLMTTPGGDDEPPRAFRTIAGRFSTGGSTAEATFVLPERRSSPRLAAAALRRALDRSRASEVMVVVAAISASEAMRDRGDRVTPIIVARGRPDDLLRAAGPPRGLTSDTTRRPGVVASVDVPPTALEFLGERVPDDLPGSPIRVEGRAPTELHQRYLEYRKVVTPVGVSVLLVALTALVVSIVLLLTRRVAAGAVRVVAAWGMLGVSLQVALLPASVLPSYRPAVVAAVVAAFGALIAAVALWGHRRSPVRPPAIVAGIGLGLVVLDVLLGWPSGLTPLLGGSALDGVRFFGLGNSYAGVVLAGSVLVSALLPPWGGVALLGAAALFAGLPLLGSDLGGGVTLFSVAGLWYGLRVRRSGWWAAGAAVAGALAGAALLVAAHRFLPSEPTHVTRAIDEVGGLPGSLGVFWDRLRLNLEVTAATPSVWPALAGLPVALWVAAARPGPVRVALERFPSWRDGAVTLAIGGMIGYVLNDTYGMASIAFVYLAMALVYPPLAMRWTSG